jgi:predicted DNA-binding transcriptional regulator AlpA
MQSLDIRPSEPAMRQGARVVELLTLRKRDVASAIGVSVRTLERLAAAGKFPTPDARCGKAPLWFPATISAWLEHGGGHIG